MQITLDVLSLLVGFLLGLVVWLFFDWLKTKEELKKKGGEK
jgi:uncharacterized protein YneF (UPF0154 family)